MFQEANRAGIATSLSKSEIKLWVTRISFSDSENCVTKAVERYTAQWCVLEILNPTIVRDKL